MATETSKPKAEPEHVELPASIPPELATELLAVLDRHLADARRREVERQFPPVDASKLPGGMTLEEAEEFRATLINRMLGIRDPERMRKAAERMDRMREEIGKRTGETDLAVQLVREARDSGE